MTNQKFIARIEDPRSPGGSDQEIKNDYNLEVLDRDEDGFEVEGTREDIQSFIDDYGIILTEEIEEA